MGEESPKTTEVTPKITKEKKEGGLKLESDWLLYLKLQKREKCGIK